MDPPHRPFAIQRAPQFNSKVAGARIRAVPPSRSLLRGGFFGFAKRCGAFLRDRLLGQRSPTGRFARGVQLIQLHFHATALLHVRGRATLLFASERAARGRRASCFRLWGPEACIFQHGPNTVTVGAPFEDQGLSALLDSVDGRADSSAQQRLVQFLGNKVLVNNRLGGQPARTTQCTCLACSPFPVVEQTPHLAAAPAQERQHRRWLLRPRHIFEGGLGLDDGASEILRQGHDDASSPSRVARCLA